MISNAAPNPDTIGNPRARHYLHSTGRQWRGADYIAWIHQQWRDFVADLGISTEAARLRHDDFDAWLDVKFTPTDPAMLTHHVAEGASPSG